MGNLKKALELLECQGIAYGDMLRLGMEQKSCVENDDLPGLESAFRGVHRAMVDIELRQAEMPDLSGSERLDRAFRESAASVREMIMRVEEIRKLNERALEMLLDRTKRDLGKLGQGRRAAKGYQNVRVRESRFHDSLR
jgi:hypothetical protein